MGVILSVDRGVIEIERGAALGSGVLVIGASKIGNNACVGTATTIFQASVTAMTVISPGSLIGDTSRQPKPKESDREAKTEPSQNNVESNVSANNGQKPKFTNKARKPQNEQNGSQPSEPDSDVVSSEGAVPSKTDTVVGKVYIDRLMMTLFPYKKSLDSESQTDRSNGSRS
jgi:carbon dioxide concentrating mechanism protein CcmN